MRQRAFMVLNPHEIARVEIAARTPGIGKKCSASLTRRQSARSPTTVPRGLGSSSDMIAGILSP
jgi:hypothetical protein